MLKCKHCDEEIVPCENLSTKSPGNCKLWEDCGITQKGYYHTDTRSHYCDYYAQIINSQMAEPED